MSCCMPESKRCLCYEGKEVMSTDAQIKSGLKLSEAVKLIEENEGALLMPENDFGAPKKFLELKHHELKVRCKYSVKLPPPKSVSVTRVLLARAVSKTQMEPVEVVLNSDYFINLCKELGL
jgi:hypothetical protein